jgi:hypothetical protein
MINESNSSITAMTLSMFAHHQHEPANFDHAVSVARRVAADPRANDVHVAVAYLQSITHNARITGPDLLRAGIPPTVVRAVGVLAMQPQELFLSYFQRIAQNHDTALVAHHDFVERLSTLDSVEDDDLTRRFRRAASDLNEAVDLNTPRVG